MGSQAVLCKVIPPVCTVDEFFDVIVDVNKLIKFCANSCIFHLVEIRAKSFV